MPKLDEQKAKDFVKGFKSKVYGDENANTEPLLDRMGKAASQLIDQAETSARDALFGPEKKKK